MNLYSRPCDLCKKSTVSIYSPESGLTVYCVKCWWSDKWDPKDYAREYDFSKPFFTQFRELQQQVPIIALANDNGLLGGSVNCEYNQDFARSKNCYMVFIAWKLEDCMYSYYLVSGENLVDCLNVVDANSFVYEGIFIENCYQSKYVYYSVAVSDSAFMYDCRDCSDSFMCVGLRHKRYCFKNKQYSKEEYEKILKEYALDTYSGMERAKEEFAPMLQTMPRKFAIFRNTVNSTGDYLSNAKNTKDCFLAQRAEDSRYVESSDTPRNCYDLYVGGELELAYEGITPDNTYLGRFAIFSWKNRDYYYVDGCHSSENVFGCVGLKKAKYCILNKEYSKEEYETLLPKIKAHMDEMPYVDKNGVSYKFGEFFPSELSYFGYNESVATDHFPLTQDEAQKKNFNWRKEVSVTTGKETIQSEDLPDAIRDVNEDILKEILACKDCGRNYRIVPQELQFYKRMQIPLPRRCFFCRHKSRTLLRNPFQLWSRECLCGGPTSKNEVYKNTAAHFHGTDSCPNTFETSYAPDRPEIVYCEACYNAEVI
ncbi:MAG: hypothetical protein AAB691_02685 [Patescibacteria group bacterium]